MTYDDPVAFKMLERELRLEALLAWDRAVLAFRTPEDRPSYSVNLCAAQWVWGEMAWRAGMGKVSYPSQEAGKSAKK